MIDILHGLLQDKCREQQPGIFRAYLRQKLGWQQYIAIASPARQHFDALQHQAAIGDGLKHRKHLPAVNGMDELAFKSGERGNRARFLSFGLATGKTVGQMGMMFNHLFQS